MDEHLAALCAYHGGFFTYAEALEGGYSKKAIARAVAAGLWVRLRHGYYAIRELYEALDRVERYRILGHAVYHRHGGRVALTHQSAAAEHGFALWGCDLSAVHATRLDGGTGRREAGVVHHVGAIDPGRDLELIDDRWVSAKPNSVWESLCTQGQESGLVLADSALNRTNLTPDDLERVAGRFSQWRGSRNARIVLRLADGRAESPGETRSRYLCYRFHLPAPELQYEVVDRTGRIVAYTDLAWPEYSHVAEFDGMIKYGRLLRPGESPGDVVVREKQREDLVRAELLGMSRLMWQDLPARQAPTTAARLRHDLDQSHRLYQHGRVVIPL